MCELKDVITFEMPFGFLGKCLEGFVKKDLQKMFDFRHKTTKEILEKGKSSKLNESAVGKKRAYFLGITYFLCFLH